MVVKKNEVEKDQIERKGQIIIYALAQALYSTGDALAAGAMHP
jgi:hypothetical protein